MWPILLYNCSSLDAVLSLADLLSKKEEAFSKNSLFQVVICCA